MKRFSTKYNYLNEPVAGSSNIFFQPKLTINNSNDKYEYEADTVANKVMQMEAPSLQAKQNNNSFFAPSPISITPVQRKCETCEEEQKMQRKEIETGAATADNNLENYIGSLSSGGQPLADDVRNFYEPRFGYDFSNVKVHTDAVAVKSAQSINALAYTSGNNIVFNNGQYSPNTDSGKKLLGHELTHVVQQNGSINAKKIQRQAAGVPIMPRGINPGDCMLTVCNTLRSMRSPVTVAAANTIVDNWLRDMLDCIHTNAPNSNASHQQAITLQAESELQNEAANSRNYITQMRPNRAGFNDFMEDLQRTCNKLQREVSIEYRYNIILDNSGLPWGYTPADNWDSIERTFASMPPESTWANPQLLTFRREAVNATQPTVAGETDVATGTITIFNRGFGTAPYGRSAATGIAATTQTIQHEIGHVIVEQIPRTDYNYFFDNVLHWHRYSWGWITAPNSPFANWIAERNALLTETGMTSTQLDTWLGTLQMNARTNYGNRSYFRTNNFLEAYDKNQVPLIPAFEYASSNKDDYLSELYTFCISNPQFVHIHLPEDQIIWLKRVVFHIPTTPGELLRRYALNEPQQTQFIVRAARMFTWQQIESVFQQVMAANRVGGGVLA
jgi:hypothetical protein